MTIPRITLIAALAAAVCSTTLAFAQAVGITPDELKFTRNPATGSELAPVLGDGRNPGPFIARVRYPAGHKSMPHSHPADTHITVMSGTMRYAEGSTFDETKFKDYPLAASLSFRPTCPITRWRVRRWNSRRTAPGRRLSSSLTRSTIRATARQPERR